MAFDPFNQNITLFITPNLSIPIPVPVIDAFNDETVSIVLNYGTQLGAAITMLLVVLFTTPPSKFLRTANMLHVLGLLVCIVRTVLLALYFGSPFSHFYPVWSNDYSRVPAWNFRESVAGTVFSMLLVIISDVSLINQAWAMVSLWPSKTKYVLCSISLLITLLSVAARTAFTVIQCEGIYDLVPPMNFAWLVHTMVILNICTTVWFCSLFNSKLIIHLINNRGVLPSHRAMSPMEVLIATNGILMIIPVIFAAIEFRPILNFESSSLTPASITLLLPLGSLVAQRLAQTDQNASPSLSSYPSSSGAGCYKNNRSSGSTTPLKSGSLFATLTNNSISATRSLSTSQNTTVVSARDIVDPIELELRQIDGYLQPQETHVSAELSRSQSHK
ncbi:putative mating type pheromone G-protein coupled receptor [Trichoderma evansii]